jgi:mRNA-degrading endonuclease HigB of HigAB toxin-antitoxin module
MKNEQGNANNLVDKTVHKHLKSLGYVFPQNKEDFEKLEEEVSNTKISKPESFKDPLKFLGRKLKKYQQQEQSFEAYEQNLAQAAREGNEISDDVKKQMEQDKKISKNKKSAK